ncbi:MAG: nucleotidyltransferase [Candidatus Eisenbacteria bacterium]
MSVPGGPESARGGLPGPGPSLVVMAAGIGSRYGGLKQVDPVGPSGEIILDYSVYDAIRAGFGKVVFVIRREIESDFRDTVGRNVEPHIDTAYTFQELSALPDGFTVPPGRKKPWGTAHAVLCAREEVPGTFAVINADDFYGAGAFAAIGQHLAHVAAGDAARRAEADADPDGSDSTTAAEYSMAGYLLENTLSEHGHVSRGVCEVTPDGFLEGIVERETIRLFPDGVKCEGPEGVWTLIPADSTVSMNIWGFGVGFFEHLDAGFREFLARNIDTSGAECYLPVVVNGLIDDGRARVRVLPTDERWFGITYREDMPTARDAIRKRIERGVYPENLWS